MENKLICPVKRLKIKKVENSSICEELTIDQFIAVLNAIKEEFSNKGNTIVNVYADFGCCTGQLEISTKNEYGDELLYIGPFYDNE